MGYSMRPRKKAQAHARSAMQKYIPRKNPKRNRSNIQVLQQVEREFYRQKG